MCALEAAIIKIATLNFAFFFGTLSTVIHFISFRDKLAENKQKIKLAAFG